MNKKVDSKTLNDINHQISTDNLSKPKWTVGTETMN